MEIRNLTQFLENLGADEVKEALWPITNALENIDHGILLYQKGKEELKEALNGLANVKKSLDKVSVPDYKGLHIEYQAIPTPTIKQSPIIEVDWVFKKYDRICLKLSIIPQNVKKNLFEDLKRKVPHKKRVYNRHTDVWMISLECVEDIIYLCKKYSLKIPLNIKE